MAISLSKLIAGASLALLGAAANAVTTYVAPNGNDASDCLTALTPCQTLQAAANKAGGNPDVATVIVADGTYTAGANIIHYRFIAFQGNCANLGAAVISTPNAVAFWVQDHAILSLKCLTINAPGGIALASRQFSIGDYESIVFGAAHQHVSASEMSKINCVGNNRISGSAVQHLQANGQSTVSAACSMTIDAGVTLGYYAGAYNRSIIHAAGGTFNGRGTQAGVQWVSDGGYISLPVGSFPGSGAGNVCVNYCVTQ